MKPESVAQAHQVILDNLGQSPDEIALALHEAGLLPDDQEWGVLDAGKKRMFGSETKAREYAEANGLRLIQSWLHDWKLVN